MGLFSCPPELVWEIFEWFVLSRDVARVMRLRLVSRRFRDSVDYTICFLRYFDSLRSNGRHPLSSRGRAKEDGHNYFQSYLVYQVLRERSTTSVLGRVRHTAQILCEDNGDTGSETIATCVKSLTRLVMEARSSCAIHNLAPDPGTCSDSQRKADICAASIYMGRKTYVERLVKDGFEIYKNHFDLVRKDLNIRRRRAHGPVEYAISDVFGGILDAAMVSGNIEMMDFLFSFSRWHAKLNDVPKLWMLPIFRWASSHGNRAVLDFAFDRIQTSTSNKKRRPEDFVYFNMRLKSARAFTTSLYIYERLTAELGQDECEYDPEQGRHSGRPMTLPLSRRTLNHRFVGSVIDGSLELVRCLLDEGATPNDSSACLQDPDAGRYTRPLLRATWRGDEVIVRTLLDAGAKPDSKSLGNTALVVATAKGNIAIAKLLLDRGAAVKEGFPPPIAIAVMRENLDMFRLLQKHGAKLDELETGGYAMAIANVLGLHSMIELLVSEGVSKDSMLRGIVCQNGDDCLWYRHCWPQEEHV